MDNKEAKDLLKQIQEEKTAAKGSPVTDAIMKSHVNREALKDIAKYLLIGAGTGAAVRGATGLGRLFGGEQEVVPSKTVDMPVLFGVPKKVEDEEEDVKKLEYKSAAEKEAISKYSLPYYLPAMLLGTPLAAYGGWKAVDAVLDKQRKAKSEDNLEEAKKDYEDSQKNILQRVGDFIGKVTRPPAALGAENPLSRTVPSGSFNISQEGKDQAAINRGIKAAEATGIPTGVAAQGGVTTQAAKDAGVKARQEAADKRAKNMADAQGIAARNPNVSIVGGRAVAANDSGKARAQAAAVNRKIQGKTVSQVKAENKKSMQDAARKRNEAFKKARAQKKKSGGGFGKSTPKKSTTKKSAPSKKSSPSKSAKSKGSTSSAGVGSARGKAAAKGRTRKSKSKSKGSSSKGSSSKGSKSSSSGRGSSRGKAAAKGRTRRGRRGRRCDIRCKYSIMPLTNMNLIKDDLAEVAYFVKELQA